MYGHMSVVFALYHARQCEQRFQARQFQPVALAAFKQIKSFDGLSALVMHRRQEDPLLGHLHVFVHRRKTHWKKMAGWTSNLLFGGSVTCFATEPTAPPAQKIACGGGAAEEGYPFVAPSVKPAMKCFCMAKNMSTGGMAASREAADTNCHWLTN